MADSLEEHIIMVAGQKHQPETADKSSKDDKPDDKDDKDDKDSKGDKSPDHDDDKDSNDHDGDDNKDKNQDDYVVGDPTASCTYSVLIIFQDEVLCIYYEHEEFEFELNIDKLQDLDDDVNEVVGRAWGECGEMEFLKLDEPGDEFEWVWEGSLDELLKHGQHYVLKIVLKEKPDEPVISPNNFEPADSQAIEYACSGQIFVKLPSGKNLTLNDVNVGDTMDTIKAKILIYSGIPVDEQRLICTGGACYRLALMQSFQ